MEESILVSTKEVLNVYEDETAFDSEITMFINSAFSTLNQIGVGPDNGFMISDKNNTWSELTLSTNLLNMVKTYIFLKTKLLFDPPAAPHALAAAERQVSEHEARMSIIREVERYG